MKRGANAVNQANVLLKRLGLWVVVIPYLVLWIVMAINPYNRFDWMLENLLIWAVVIVLIATCRIYRFSLVSYVLIAVFLSLHTIGAHYSYNSTPLDVWLHHLFTLQRDPYDRVVHFSYGLLLAYPIRELLLRNMNITKLGSSIISITIILASGAFYELIEMWVALLVAPEIGTLFLGTQGDPWDTQHDMELAMYGAVLAMLVTWDFAKWRSRP
jgi:putative membrane protein